MKNKLQSLGTILWKKKWLVLAIVAVAGAGGFFVYNKAYGAKEELTTTHPQKQTLKQTIEISGSVDAEEKADLTFASSSKLSWVGVREGDTVKKWQTIAKVDTGALEKQLQQDINAFVNIARDHTTDWDDYEKTLHPDILANLRPHLEAQKFNLDRKVLYSLDTAALDIEIKQLSIRLSSLYSPIAGMVTNIDKPFAGMSVTPADVFQIVNPSSVYFSGVVDEVDIALVREAQSALLTLDAYPEEELATSVGHVEFTPSTTRSGGTGYRIKLPLPPNDFFKYRLGMNGTATLLIDEKVDVLTIPTDSIIVRDGTSYVQVSSGETTEEREIKTGLETDEYTEVLSGLAESDLVVVPEQE